MWMSFHASLQASKILAGFPNDMAKLPPEIPLIDNSFNVFSTSTLGINLSAETRKYRKAKFIRTRTDFVYVNKNGLKNTNDGERVSSAPIIRILMMVLVLCRDHVSPRLFEIPISSSCCLGNRAGDLGSTELYSKTARPWELAEAKSQRAPANQAAWRIPVQRSSPHSSTPTILRAPCLDTHVRFGLACVPNWRRPATIISHKFLRMRCLVVILAALHIQVKLADTFHY